MTEKCTKRVRKLSITSVSVIFCLKAKAQTVQSTQRTETISSSSSVASTLPPAASKEGGAHPDPMSAPHMTIPLPLLLPFPRQRKQVVF